MRQSLGSTLNHLRTRIGRWMQPHRRTIKKRVEMTAGCRDCDAIPKVPDAGRVLKKSGTRVQVMHEGTLVTAGGYYGDWMTKIIRHLQGHHEPQEELLFHHLLKACAPGSLMIEVGAFWAYYTAWWLGAVPEAKAVCLEPDDNNRAIGERNLALNGRSAIWISSIVGAAPSPSVRFHRESDGKLIEVPCHSIESLLDKLGRPKVEMLHIDCQGAEAGFLSSIHRAAEEGLLRFVFVSTHHESISGSRTTHGDCQRIIRDAGGLILSEHSVSESYSGDRLIVASFRKEDAALQLPSISRNSNGHAIFRSLASDPKRPILAYTNNGPMIVGADDRFIGASLRARGTFDEQKLSEVVYFLRKKFHFEPKLFVDIGANIGTHLLRSLDEGLFAQAVGIEMDPTNYKLLRCNITLNGYADRTKLWNVAVSDRSGLSTMELSQDNSGDHRLRSEGVAVDQLRNHYDESNRATRMIPCKTLDQIEIEFGGDFTDESLLWMDVQGHEGQVLDGAQRILNRNNPPCLVLEFWPYGLERAGGIERVQRFLEDCQAVYDIGVAGWQNSAALDRTALRNLAAQIAQNMHRTDHTDLLCIPRNSTLEKRQV